MKREDKEFYIDQIQTDVALISFLTVFSVFFIGALLPQFNEYSLAIRIPLSFLIISTIAFLFSALILSNTTPEIIKEKLAKAEKHFSYGYVISEYLGVYLFVFSIPLIINVITEDMYLRVTTLIATLIGMAFYQFMGFSVLEGHFPRSYKWLSCLTTLGGVVLYLSQIYSFYFIHISLAFLVWLVFITVLAIRK